MLSLLNEAQGTGDGFLDLAVQFRRLAGDYAELSRQLMVLADQMDRGDGLAPGKPLGEVGERIVASILSGKRDDLG